MKKEKRRHKSIAGIVAMGRSRRNIRRVNYALMAGGTRNDSDSESDGDATDIVVNGATTTNGRCGRNVPRVDYAVLAGEKHDGNDEESDNEPIAIVAQTTKAKKN